MAEGREWVQRALDAGGDDLAAGHARSGLWTAAMLAHYQGDYDAQRPLAVAEPGGGAGRRRPADARAGALRRGDVAGQPTRPGRARARYREVLALCERLGDDAGIAMACNDLGELARAAGALDEARALYERALGLWRAGGDASGVARAAHNLGQDDARSRRARPRRRAAAGVARGVAAASAIAIRTPRPWRAWRRWPPRRRRAPAAATLHGAAQAELDAAGIALDPIDERPFRDAESALRAALGDERFAEAGARGRALATTSAGASSSASSGRRAGAGARASSPGASWRSSA